MTQDAIHISGLTKFYRRNCALKDISLTVREGDFFGFLGPNGAGKTTTIHAVTGLVNFQLGQIRVFGSDVVRDYRLTRSLIGLVPQEFNFDPYLSAEQILTFEAGYFGMPKREAKARTYELLEELELLGHKHLDYRKLSGGLKRRLLIARGLVHRPKILILDEPTAGVDLELRLRLWEFFRELNRSGVTIFLTTHYIEEAERLCKTIGVIHRGEIVALEKTQTLLETMGHHGMMIYLDRPLAAVPPAFHPFAVELVADGKAIRFRNGEGKLDALLKAIHAEGFQVRNIEIEKSTLEEVFLDMTRD